jgi:hypothetical protein
MRWAGPVARFVENFLAVKTDISTSIDHNEFYSSCKYMLHVSAVLSIFRHLNT